MHCLAGGGAPVEFLSGLAWRFKQMYTTYVRESFPQSASFLHTLSINAVVIALRRSKAFNFVSGLSGIRLGLLVWVIGTKYSSLRWSPSRRVLSPKRNYQYLG